VFCGYNCFAQTPFVPIFPDRNELRGGYLQWPDDEDYIEGTPYLFDDFISGNLYYKGELLFSRLPLRLNLHKDEIEFLRNDSIFVVDHQVQIDQIVINGEVLLFLDGKHNAIVSGIVKTWSQEFPAVITKMNKHCFSATYHIPFKVKPDRFERIDEHFVWISEDEILKVTSVKQIVKALGHSPELAAYAKKQQITADNPVKLTELLGYYQNLTKEL
jgi:hypothetical protein